MNELALWAWWATPENLGRLVINVLAVAGGALVGGLASGMLLQLIVRLTTAGKVPNWVLQVVRILGATALAWLVALFVFNDGSGSGNGPGGGTGTAKEGGGNPSTATTRGETTRSHGSESSEKEVVTVRVQVLLDRQNNATVFRPEGQPDRFGLEGIEKYVKERQRWSPLVRHLELVIWTNSPDRESGDVKSLLSWARREGLETSIDTPPGSAPE